MGRVTAPTAVKGPSRGSSAPSTSRSEGPSPKKQAKKKKQQTSTTAPSTTAPKRATKFISNDTSPTRSAVVEYGSIDAVLESHSGGEAELAIIASSDNDFASPEARVFPRVAGLKLKSKPCRGPLLASTEKAQLVSTSVEQLLQTWRPAPSASDIVSASGDTKTSCIQEVEVENSASAANDAASSVEPELRLEGQLQERAGSASLKGAEESIEDIIPAEDVPEFFRDWYQETYHRDVSEDQMVEDTPSPDKPPVEAVEVDLPNAEPEVPEFFKDWIDDGQSCATTDDSQTTTTTTGTPLYNPTEAQPCPEAAAPLPPASASPQGRSAKYVAYVDLIPLVGAVIICLYSPLYAFLYLMFVTVTYLRFPRNV